MKRKRVVINKSSKVRRQRDPIPWKYCALTVVCGLLLVSGFFVAAKQHFSAIGLAMENADLRVRISKLKDEKRRLLLSKERASSPGRITKLAKTIGFTAYPKAVVSSASEFRPETASSTDAEPVFSYADDRTEESTDPAESVVADKSKVKKTADVRPFKTVKKALDNGSQVAVLSANGSNTGGRK